MPQVARPQLTGAEERQEIPKTVKALVDGHNVLAERLTKPVIDDLIDNAVRRTTDITLNLDPLGAGRVRYESRFTAPFRDGVTETAAIYIKNEHGLTWDSEQRYTYGIYGDQDQYQQLAGGAWSKIVHRGWGDAHFVAIMATGDEVPISDASNTTPIVITTTRKHGFGHDNVYMVEDVTGNTAANGLAWYSCRVTGEYTIELWDGVNGPVAGNGAYTGGGKITCINSPVGYEAAHFGENFLLQYYPTAAERAPLVNTIGRADGAVGFLSSIQAGFMPGGGIMPGDLVPGTDVWESGLGRNKLFEALVENDQLFSGGCFIAADTPNRAFVAHKRQYFRDTAGPPSGNGIGAFSMFVLEEAYYNPQNNDGSATAAMTRWEIDNDAAMKQFSLLSSAGTQFRAAPSIYQYGSYWNGAASVQYGMRHHMDVTAVTPAANYDLLFGPPGAEVVKFRFKSDGTFQALAGNLDMQSNDIVNVDDITFTGSGSILDMQLGTITAADTINFRSSLQGTSVAATGVDTLRDSPAFQLLGAYWNGAASVTYGVRQFFDLAATTPLGRLLYQIGTPGSETTRLILNQDGALEMVGDAATSGATTKDSPPLWLEGAYWDGAASVVHAARFLLDVTTTAPASNLILQFGPPSAPVTRFIFQSGGGVDLQGGAIAACGELTVTDRLLTDDPGTTLQTGLRARVNVGGSKSTPRIMMGPAENVGHVLHIFTFQGRNGAGAISIGTLVAGDVVRQIQGIQPLHFVGGAEGNFESTISVTGELQQSSASDLSTKNYLLFIERRSSTGATTERPLYVVP
jgi:hypothetical protein